MSPCVEPLDINNVAKTQSKAAKADGGRGKGAGGWLGRVGRVAAIEPWTRKANNLLQPPSLTVYNVNGLLREAEREKRREERRERSVEKRRRRL